MLGAVIQANVYEQSKKTKDEEQAQLAVLTKWNDITITDDRSKITDEYEMIYPLLDSTVVTDIIIMRKEGNYYLLSKWTGDIDHQYSEGTATVEVITSTGAKTIKLKETNTDNRSGKFLTAQNKEVDFSSVLLFPKGVFPYKGVMQIHARNKTYIFNFE